MKFFGYLCIMITFIVCLFCLIFGNFFYGKFLERKIGADPKIETPLKRLEDGVDFVPMKTWKMFIIQFLNIAGLGPIFGAMLGAAFGPMAFVWIVLGNIFIGSMHDYCAGMLSLRGNGRNAPTIIGHFLGSNAKKVLMIVTMFLLIATGVSFVVGPVDLLHELTKWDRWIWLAVIFAYYIVATVLPINKIIGRIYPVFGIMLLIMAVSVASVMLFKSVTGQLQMVEIGLDSFRNFHFDAEKYPMIPMLFVVVSCGAISGFHSTQSPLMARCMSSELQGRKVFHAAMACEGIVTLIWAAASIAYFGGAEGLNQQMVAGNSTAVLVNQICNSWLGKVGAVLAIAGIIVCPISTGDTAMRSCRLIIADNLHLDQKKISRRLAVALPCFLLVFLLSRMNFDNVWTLVGISNQFLSMMMLWAISVAFATRKPKRLYLVSAIPAIFMTFVVVSYILVAPHANGGLALNATIGRIAGIVAALAVYIFFKKTTTLSNKQTF